MAGRGPAEQKQITIMNTPLLIETVDLMLFKCISDAMLLSVGRPCHMY